MTVNQKKFEPISEMLLDGATPFEIRQVLGVNGSAVYYVRKKLGLPRFKSGRIPGFSVESKWRQLRPELLKMKQSGLTYGEIGEKLGVSRQMIQQTIRLKISADQCHKCGTAGAKIDTHHTSYTDEAGHPMCVSCHSKEHTKLELKKKSAEIILEAFMEKTSGMSPEHIKSILIRAGIDRLIL